MAITLLQPFNFDTTANYTFNTVNVSSNINITGNVTSNNANLGNLLIANYHQGTLTTGAQPNITSVGTLTSLTITGNLSSGNANLGNLLIANYHQGTLTTGAQPNITSTGTLTGLTVGPNSSITLSGTTGFLKGNSIQGNDGTATYYMYYGSVAGAGGVRTDLTVGASGTGNLTVNGSITSTGTVTAQDVNTLSDMTLKDNPEQIIDPFTILNQLSGMSFSWKSNGKKSYGLMAQMIEDILPELVSTVNGKKTVNYIPIIAFLIEAVKKQQQDIDTLKNQFKN